MPVILDENHRVFDLELGMKYVVLLWMFLLIGSSALAKKKAGFFGGKLFAEGYDPVSYLDLNKAVEGKKSIQHVHQETTFQFSSESHKAKFIANPAKYIPAYNLSLIHI